MRFAGSDRAFVNILSPTRREEVVRALNILDNSAAADLTLTDPSISQLLSKLEGSILADVAGKGVIDTNQRGTQRKNKGQAMLKREAPQQYDNMEQDLLEILSYRKGLDYIEAPEVFREEPNANNPIVQKLNEFLDNATVTGLESIGAGGVGGPTSQRGQLMRKAYIEQGATPEQALEMFNNRRKEVAKPATARFLAQNLMGNSIGEQPVFTSNHNTKGGLPIEHMHTPFNADPTKGIDVDNRDLGSRMKNSTLGDKPPERAQQLLVDSLEKMELQFESDYGISIQDAMDTYAMNYRNDNDQKMYPAVIKPPASP